MTGPVGADGGRMGRAVTLATPGPPEPWVLPDGDRIALRPACT